ncbi:hypothetical protein DV738_g1447, partial [Chaetothyriales sp. CBS 135597]
MQQPSPLQLALTKPSASERLSSTSAVTSPAGTSKVCGSSSTKKAKGETKAKPVKLRAACNNCFSAKVRCNGDKTGCARCLEKKLSCVYSESRVGKVVGKRRKRLIEETAIGTVDSEAWVIKDQKPFHLPASNPDIGSQANVKTGFTCFTGLERQYVEPDNTTTARFVVRLLLHLHMVSLVINA